MSRALCFLSGVMCSVLFLGVTCIVLFSVSCALCCFQVRCSAQCLPACSYTWYLASRRLDTGDGLLVIPAVTRQDAGTYTCHADNGVGRRMSQELLVDVQCQYMLLQLSLISASLFLQLNQLPSCSSPLSLSSVV